MTVSIGIGLVLSLLFSELFALAAGGMVVPGYLAVALHEPLSIISTLAIAWATWLLVSGLGQYIVLYGRRRTVLMILVGFLLNALFTRYANLHIETGSLDLSAIGHIIPGLIAIWFERQGAVATTAALTIAVVSIRLILILIYGVDLNL